MTRSALVNTLALSASVAVGLLLTPLALKAAGAGPFGFWKLALSLNAVAAFATFGLGRAVAREAAGGDSRFLNAAFHAHLAAGLVILGLFSATRHPLLALAGAVFFADQLIAWGVEVLTGLSRFDRMGSAIVAGECARAVATVVALGLGFGIEGVALGLLAGRLLTAGIAYAGLGPALPRLAAMRSSWTELKSRADFIGFSQGIAFLSQIV